jgi:hypothetical protein
MGMVQIHLKGKDKYEVDDNVEDPQFPGGRQTALELALGLANITKSSSRVSLLS